jgi:hypothetical protein
LYVSTVTQCNFILNEVLFDVALTYFTISILKSIHGPLFNYAGSPNRFWNFRFMVPCIIK